MLTDVRVVLMELLLINFWKNYKFLIYFLLEEFFSKNVSGMLCISNERVVGTWFKKERVKVTTTIFKEQSIFNYLKFYLILKLKLSLLKQ